MLDKIVFKQSRFFFTFFLQHVSFTLFHLCPRRFWKVLLALILGGPSKSCVFEKILMTCRTPVKDAGFILILASVGIR